MMIGGMSYCSLAGDALSDAFRLEELLIVYIPS